MDEACLSYHPGVSLHPRTAFRISLNHPAPPRSLLSQTGVLHYPLNICPKAGFYFIVHLHLHLLRTLSDSCVGRVHIGCSSQRHTGRTSVPSRDNHLHNAQDVQKADIARSVEPRFFYPMGPNEGRSKSGNPRSSVVVTEGADHARLVTGEKGFHPPQARRCLHSRGTCVSAYAPEIVIGRPFGFSPYTQIYRHDSPFRLSCSLGKGRRDSWCQIS